MRVIAFNRFHIALMFFVIASIGGCGVFALMQNQRSADLAAVGDDRASEISRLGSALDAEQVELRSGTPARDEGRMARFLSAARTFRAVLTDLESDASASELPIVRSIQPLHEQHVRDGIVEVTEIARGHEHAARALETLRTWPTLAAIRDDLATVEAESDVANERGDAIVREGNHRLMTLIAGVTLVALVLMSFIALVLGQYKRHAATAADDKIAGLELAALSDNLTGLGNHRAFSEDFAREIARAKRSRHPLVLALFDIDDFKAVNDSRGHVHGDDVLAGVGRLLRSLREEDRAYRVGGDEFALLLVETDAAAAAIALGRLRNNAPDNLSGATLSVGYVNLTPEQLDREPYELADTALYEAKRRGRNALVCFDEIADSVDVFSPRKAVIVRRLIAEDLVSIAFQPIWDIDTTRPLAFEALARPASELGLSGPQEAFDIAERIRQVYELDTVCIRKALDSVPNLPPGSTIFLNVSPATLAHARFEPSDFVSQVRAAGLDPKNVVIELTERRIEDQTSIIQRARALRALGIRMALDDTGSGHAGLEILSKLQLDFVKIDRSLLVKAVHDAGARGVLAGIIAIARETGSYLIAEGIENRELLDFACRAHQPGRGTFAGIRGVQGYLLGRPELGQVNAHALEEHHAYLVTRIERDEPKAA